jgi:aspartate kinase
MVVLKFGGTSVGSASSIKQVVAIIAKIDTPKIVVLSAVSGTTNALVEIIKLVNNKEKTSALESVHQLHNSYLNLITKLYNTPKYKERAHGFVSTKFNGIKTLIERGEQNNVDAIIIAQGEILSTNLVQLYLEESQIQSSLISALDFMEIDENNEPKIEVITKKLSPLLETNQNLWITQGFICKNERGEISNLQRGGSDYTASLIGAAINAKEIQIWTDIDGMHNNDPRFVENTFSLEEISFDEAAELAYFGAKILHPQSLIPAKENNIPVLLKNTFNPLSKGTIIQNKTVQNGVTAIAAKDGITAIKIKSYRMLLAYGFLKKIFEVFEKYKTPIDMITTSEVAVSLTIDDASNLDEIIIELEPFGKIEIDENLSIVCVAGDFYQNKEGISADVFNSLRDIPIRMISYGGSNYNTSLLVKTDDKIAALNALNVGLFNKQCLLSEAVN